MSKRNIPGWAQTLANWRTNFPPLPTIQLEPMMTDDDVDFATDMIYFRALLDSICEQATNRWPEKFTIEPAISTTMSTLLDAALVRVREDFPSVEECALVATRVFGAL